MSLRRLASSSEFPPEKSLEQSVGLRWWVAVWRDPAGGSSAPPLSLGSQLVDARALPREGFAPVQPNNQRDIQVIHFLLSSDPSSSQGASSLPVYLNGEIFGLCPGIEFVFRPLFKARQ